MGKYNRRVRSANKNRKLFPLAMLWTYLTLLAPAFGTEAIVDGRRLKFDPPAGYCLLNEQEPRDRDTMQALRQIQKPDSTPLWMFADCGDLALLRAGKTTRLNRYGQVAAVQATGVFRPQPGMSRFEFASQLARNLPALDISRLARTAQGHTASPDAPSYRLLHFGLAATDAAAAYAGLLVEENGGRARAVTAGVMAMTLVKDLPISVTLYAPYSELSGYRSLRNEMRPVLGSFIARNEVRAGSAASRGPDAGSEAWDVWLRKLAMIDWNGALMSGLLSLGFASVVFVAAHRYRSWQQ